MIEYTEDNHDSTLYSGRNFCRNVSRFQMHTSNIGKLLAVQHFLHASLFICYTKTPNCANSKTACMLHVNQPNRLLVQNRRTNTLINMLIDENNNVI